MNLGPKAPISVMEDIHQQSPRGERWESRHRCPGCGATKVAPDFTCEYCGRLRRDVPEDEVWDYVTRLQEYLTPPKYVSLHMHGNALRAKVRRTYGI